MNTYIHTYVCMYVAVYTYIHTQMRTSNVSADIQNWRYVLCQFCICLYVCVYLCVCVCVHVYVCVYVYDAAKRALTRWIRAVNSVSECIHVLNIFSCVYVLVDVFMYICVRMCICMCVCVYPCMYAYDGTKRALGQCLHAVNSIRVWWAFLCV